MKVKKDLIIAVITTFCLTATLLMAIPANSASMRPYDPWADLDDDGHVSPGDLANLIGHYGSYGTAINKTALLLDLQSRIDALNATVLALQSQVVAMESRIDELNGTVIILNENLAILNNTKGMRQADKDSGWHALTPGGTWIYTHNLNTTDVLVYFIGKESDTQSQYVHQHDYGGENTGLYSYGAFWKDLTATTVSVYRNPQDGAWNWVRIIIWKIPPQT